MPLVRAGDEEEWDQQRSWHSELMSGLHKVDLSVEQLQHEQERWMTQGDGRPATLRAAVGIMPLLSFMFGKWHSEGRCSLPSPATMEMRESGLLQSSPITP